MLNERERGPMKTITVMGIDLAKSVFHVYGVDSNGKAQLRKKLDRKGLMKVIANTAPCLIGVEACGGSNYWARKFEEHGHEVKMMPPQYVKPYVKTNKNDFNDAEGICEAVQRPNMHFVPKKSVEQQDIQMVHRIRQRLVAGRVALVNEARGLLAEYGIVIGKGVSRFNTAIVQIIGDNKNGLTSVGRRKMRDLLTELNEMQERIKAMDVEISRIYENSDTCKRIGKIPGIGPVTATAIVAAVSDAGVFKNGRQMSAWLGIVPRQDSTGGKPRLLGISKRGDIYLRTLLIHGGRSVVLAARNKTDKYSQWVTQKATTRGKNKAAVAVANKNARIIWKLLNTGESYKAAV
jgi:transposase